MITRILSSLICAVVLLSTIELTQAQQIEFKKTQIETKFRSEGVAVADFNNDGKKDIAAGSVWYEAPNWKMHSILEQPKEFPPKKYSDSFCTYAQDADGDGLVDVFTVDFPGKPTWWFKNPGKAGGAWKRHECTKETNNESPMFIDVDGDGVRDLVQGYSEGQMIIAWPDKDPTKPWIVHPISEKKSIGTFKYYHGLGVGDINKDGRNDVLIPHGWWEAPEKKDSGKWTFHKVNFFKDKVGEKASNMHVFDFDGDGDNDVLSSSAHEFGIWWHEQSETGWKTHEIAKDFSQTHSMCFADINSDGLPDFVTGKRYWAHGGRDPGGDQPAVMYWFELQRENGKPKWIPHQFDHDSGVGTQFEVIDVNGDNLLDVVTSNKKGVFYFEQVRK